MPATTRRRRRRHRPSVAPKAQEVVDTVQECLSAFRAAHHKRRGVRIFKDAIDALAKTGFMVTKSRIGTLVNTTIPFYSGYLSTPHFDSTVKFNRQGFYYEEVGISVYPKGKVNSYGDGLHVLAWRLDNKSTEHNVIRMPGFPAQWAKEIMTDKTMTP